MKFIADFHLHSKYSRATSPQMDLENMAQWAKIKGIKVLTTGDFTHPEWFKELKEKLVPAEQGLYRLKSKIHSSQRLVPAGLHPNYSKSNPKSKIQNLRQETNFILTSEISCIYSKGGKVRKIHIVVFAPSLEVVEKINIELSKIGNLKADGRPILGLDAKELAKIVLNTSKDCLVVPAHLWTPWFGLLGSKSGFDSIEECFEEYSKYIYAVETGLSSDPAMNWRLSELDKITLISNSDAHSPAKMGREVNVFNTELSYSAISEAIKSKNPQEFLYTIEFFPQEGKYHYDGHRSCDICLSPQESKKYNNICPRCGRPLTIGVLNRVAQLADRQEGFKPKGAIPFKSLIPLAEIISECLEKGVGTKTVGKEYDNLIKNLGSEFEILLDVSETELKNATLPEIAEGIIRVRQGKVDIEPGYDGVFGKIRIFSKAEKKNLATQNTLF